MLGLALLPQGHRIIVQKLEEESSFSILFWLILCVKNDSSYEHYH